MDIISLPVEIDEKKIDGRYRLVMVASQRAKELAAGGKPKVQTKSKKITTIAIEEAVKDKLEFVVGEEARKAREEAKKFDYRKLLEEKRKEATPEELTELEKDLKVYLHERESIDKKALEELFGERQDEVAEE
ncbi:MAG: DNA-directed RNA polymerase subunit omega [Nitrospiraceae bacterium]|nr:DNA-directed RNA polymerase subunit omega [Nitrospiraceae bacterium]